MPIVTVFSSDFRRADEVVGMARTRPDPLMLHIPNLLEAISAAQFGLQLGR
ncbi:hypothetical protein PCS_01205 [Desulfocurvibacter africanus PCS]|uniref:Uncharacterized protein n=1 Tax=Desulfocurvibacter africanus PCS TaxID=1262666 RepID=M5PVN0_DESAF|nr:hypothetical protein [Desulfocurvibacter africanus]EMG38035.1 hypothetical protein PCS_01205 [Desulfocurvibacter africanus PCS]